MSINNLLLISLQLQHIVYEVTKILYYVLHIMLSNLDKFRSSTALIVSRLPISLQQKFQFSMS